MLSNRCLNSWLFRDFPAVPTISEMHLIPFTSYTFDILSSNIFLSSHKTQSLSTAGKPGVPLWPMIWSFSQHWALQPPSTILSAHTALLRIHGSSQTEAEWESKGDGMCPVPHTDPVMMANKLQRNQQPVVQNLPAPCIPQKVVSSIFFIGKT